MSDVLENNTEAVQDAPETEATEQTAVLFSAEQVEDMAGQLRIGDVVETLNQVQEETLSLVAQLEEQIASQHEVISNLSQRVDQLTDALAEADLAVSRAGGFPVLSEDSRTPNLGYNGLLESLTLGNRTRLKYTAPAETAKDVPAETTAPSGIRKEQGALATLAKKREKFQNSSERITAKSQRVRQLWRGGQ